MSGFPDGWSYDAALVKGGLNLTNIRHDSHSMAAEVGLIKCYAESVGPDGAKFLPFDLGASGMRNIKKPKKWTSAESGLGRVRSPDFFHTQSHEVYAVFVIDALLGCDGQTFQGKQYYAFTAPSDTPRHETTGTAKAGRFYPSIDFFLPQRKESEDASVISKLRFDYFFDVNIAGGGRRNAIYNPVPSAETYHKIADYTLRSLSQIEDSLLSGDIPTMPSGKKGASRNQAPMYNREQAGLFKDLDAAFPLRVARFPKAGAHTFRNAEKPLLWEVAADGILYGTGRSIPSDWTAWDNIHIWGYHPDGLVSTPGMPYGLHLHWRWAASTTDVSSIFIGELFGDFSKKRFDEDKHELAGRDKQGNPIFGGPLIDPKLARQDLRVAFVKKETARAYAKETAKSNEEFSEILKRIKAKPDPISEGDDCVLLISIVVHRTDANEPWSGTIFPHGFFFPHDYNPHTLLMLGLPFEGAYFEQYLPDKPTTREWLRYPKHR